MPLKLRDLIRNVRACRTAAEERAVIAKECADIRTSFRSKDDEHLRHRNVAKLLYIHMLGYPTHFGQMEAMKLLATQRFAEKRIGYLALMLLLDENQELLMLATNSMKKDLESTNPYIQGLALCTIGNIASQAIARDLSLDIIKVMTSSGNNPYIRKKAALCALRTIRRVEDLVEDYIKPAAELLNDRNNSVQMCGIHLMKEIVKISPEESIQQYRLLIPRLCTILRSTWNVSYNPEYDVMGINDPFLQITVLRFLRVLCQTTITVNKIDPETNITEQDLITLGPIEDDHLDKINDILTQLSANIDPYKVPGAAIHYEAILATLTISNDQTLRVNAIIQLGKFLQSRDNNIRYISLNTMYQVAQQQLSTASTSLKGVKGVQLRELKQQQHNAVTNLEVIQRYRNTIVAYLKDPDPSIRKRALSLIYALVTEKNVRPLVRELLMYLALKSQATDNGPNTTDTSFTNVPALVTTSLPYGGGPSFQLQSSNKDNYYTQSSNAEFKCDLTHKIYYIIYQYAPNIIWQLHSMIMLLSTDNEYINENTFFEFVSLIQNYSKSTLYTQHVNTPLFTIKTNNNTNPITITKAHIDSFIIHELFLAVNHQDRIKYPFLIQAFLFFVSQHSQYLTSTQGPQLASIISQFLTLDATSTTTPQQPNQQQQPLYEPNTYEKVTYEVITNLINAIMEHPYTTEGSKQVGLSAAARLLTTIKKAVGNNTIPADIQTSLNTLEYVLSMHRTHVNVDLQQRATEYLTISRSKNDKLDSTQFATKILYPVVNFTRTNLDFEQDDDTSVDSTPNTTPQQQEVDVFAAMNNNEQTTTTTTTTTSQDTTTSTTTAPTPQQPAGFDILNDLLQPTSTPTTQQQPKPAFVDPLGETDIFQQAQQMNNNTTNTIPTDLGFGAIASQGNDNANIPTVPADPFGDLLGSNTISTPVTNNNNNNNMNNNTTQNNSTDIFGMLDASSSTTPSNNNNNSMNTFSTTSTTPSNNTSTNSNSFLDDFGLGGISTTKSSQPTTQSTNILDDDDFDDFESAEPEIQSQPIEKTITVFNANDITIKFVYTSTPNEPTNGITYKINAVMTTTSSSIDAQSMDLRLATRPPLTKTIKVPSTRTLTSSSPITQELTIINPSTVQEGQTNFKCMFKCVLNGTPFDSPAFSVSI